MKIFEKSGNAMLEKILQSHIFCFFRIKLAQSNPLEGFHRKMFTTYFKI